MDDGDDGVLYAVYPSLMYEDKSILTMAVTNLHSAFSEIYDGQ